VAELILYAIPAFVLLLLVELLSFKYARDEELVGYEARDTRTSLTMGGGNVVINAVWKLVVAHDVRHAKNWRERLGFLFRGPGWSPDGSGGGTRG
jgi:hypothetical protein